MLKGMIGEAKEMKPLFKYVAAYIAVLAFYGGDIATATLMYFMAGGLYLGLRKGGEDR